jgi:hypothetical protein
MEVKDLKPGMVLDLFIPYKNLNAWSMYVGCMSKNKEICITDHFAKTAKVICIEEKANLIFTFVSLHQCKKRHVLHLVDLPEETWRVNPIETMKLMKENK